MAASRSSILIYSNKMAEELKFSLLAVAGEASGDQHLAAVVAALLRLNPSTTVFGMGGSAARAAGMETVVDCHEAASVMGVTEVFGKLGRLTAAFRTLLKAADERRPKVAILVDFPDFNFLLLRALHKRGIKVLYYVSPQLWAWRRGRIHTIKRYVAKMIPIFPFESRFYQDHGVSAVYLGNPLLDETKHSFDRFGFLQTAGLDPAKPILALLPGSRRGEVSRLLTPMLEAFNILKQSRPELQALIPVAETLDFDWVKGLRADCSGSFLVKAQAPEVLRAATAAVVASGTATLQSALAQLPLVVVYRLSPITYAIGRLLVRGVKDIAIVNLIAGYRVVPELLQDQVTPARIATAVAPLLTATAERTKMLAGFDLIRQRLEYVGPPGESSADRVAREILNLN